MFYCLYKTAITLFTSKIPLPRLARKASGKLIHNQYCQKSLFRVITLDPRQQKYIMTNVGSNKITKALDKLTVPAFEKRTNKSSETTQQLRRLFRSDLSHNTTSFIPKQDYMHLPYSQFRSRLVSYLCQNQPHIRLAAEQAELQALNHSCEWLNIKKQHSRSCKNQTKNILNKRKKKNIKQYISEAALSKKKRSWYRTESNSEDQVGSQTKLNNVKSAIVGNSVKRRISLIVAAKQPPTLDRLIPIHHTQAHFYEKDQLKQSNCICCKQQPLENSEHGIQEMRKEEVFVQKKRRIPQSKVKNVVQEEQEDPFQGKFSENQKFQRLFKSADKNTPIRTNIVKRKQKPHKSEQEANEISPWKRRNTVDSQNPPEQNS